MQQNQSVKVEASPVNCPHGLLMNGSCPDCRKLKQDNLDGISACLKPAMQRIRSEILNIWGGCEIELVKTIPFDRVYSGHPGEIGQIEVSYFDTTLKRRNHALFGVTLGADITCHAN